MYSLKEADYRHQRHATGVTQSEPNSSKEATSPAETLRGTPRRFVKL